MRRDVLTWEQAQAAWKQVLKELSAAVEQEIRAFQAAGRVSPCCIAAFRKTRNRFDSEVWPDRLKKLLLRQTKAKRKGPVNSRHR